ncbi:MAG: SRPBCC domain-containing protein [Chloroflexota bacterium]
MDTRSAAEATTTMDRTTIERTSDQELLVTRTIDGPPDVVFEAWIDAGLFRQWWVPKSMGLKLLTCEVDARVGGGYRLTFDIGTAEPMAFFGRYLEVTPPTRLVWTNEEGDEGTVVTTVTFEEDDGRTRLVVHDRYPSKEALDEAVASGATSWNPETFDQLDELLVKLGSSTRR